MAHPNEFIARRAKAGAMLQHVYRTGERPHGLDASTGQVWDALVLLDCVLCKPNGRADLSVAGRALHALTDSGEW